MHYLLQAKANQANGTEKEPVKQTVVPDRTLPGTIDARGNYPTGVVVFTVVAILAAVVGAWWYLQRIKPPKWQTLPPAESDPEAFDRLCDANDLSRREREVLRAAAIRRDSRDSLSLFIDPISYDEAMGLTTGADRALMLDVRRKLFSSDE